MNTEAENSTRDSFTENDICVIGVPSYGGRVPSIALERMKAYKGNNTKELNFAQKISKKINSNSTFEKLNVPGNFPYREYKGVPLKPKAGRQSTKNK